MHDTRPIRCSLAAALLLATTLVAQDQAQQALDALNHGNRRHVEGRPAGKPLGEGARRTLAQGQHPFAIVVTCADSRVSPEHVFSAGLGELFVVRTAGNVCDPSTLASVEYAASHLGVPLCIVLGHTGCSTVRAAVERDRGGEAMQRLLDRIEPAVRAARADGLLGAGLCAQVEIENTQQTIHDALRRSALLRDLVRDGKLKIVAGLCRVETGAVEWLPERAPDLGPPPAERGERLQRVVGPPPHVVFGHLQAGHRRFLSSRVPAGDTSASRRAQVALGERPQAVIVTCSDSRVPPEHLFDAGLGELAVVRVAGNVLNDEVQASIEHAVQRLGASLVLVLGHSRCGAMQSACEHQDDPQLSPSMRSLVAQLEPAVAAARARGASGDELVERAVERHALRFVERLRASSKVVRELERQGSLSLVAAVYELDSGDLRWLKDGAPFAPTATPPPAPQVEVRPDAHEVSQLDLAPIVDHPLPPKPTPTNDLMALPPQTVWSLLASAAAIGAAGVSLALAGQLRRERRQFIAALQPPEETDEADSVEIEETEGR
jgi:carbonic anhydrase